MINYYNVTEKLQAFLIGLEDINSVTTQRDLIDTKKQTMFPTSLIEVTNASPINGITRFSVTVMAIDIVDIVKTGATKDENEWKGNDNRENILNTMYAVLEQLDQSIDKGSLSDLGWELQGNISAQRLEDYLGNLLYGWVCEFVVDVPNSIQNCAV